MPQMETLKQFFANYRLFDGNGKLIATFYGQ
jgi:hypothetical protein